MPSTESHRVAAPVIGGSVADLIGWRGIFYILLGIGVVITGLVIPVKETLPKEAREQGSFWRSFEGFALVCKVLNFAVFTTVFGLGMGALFAYISSTPFILQNEYGLSQFHFSLIFALNAVGDRRRRPACRSLLYDGQSHILRNRRQSDRFNRRFYFRLNDKRLVYL